jgi:hypothetical protein
MDEILKRLGLLETIVTDVRLQVTSIAALLPTFPTKSELLSTKAELKEDIHAVRVEVQALRAELKTDVQALRTELKTDVGALRSDMSSMEARLIRWFVCTAIAIAALAFSAAKYVH